MSRICCNNTDGCQIRYLLEKRNSCRCKRIECHFIHRDALVEGNLSASFSNISLGWDISVHENNHSPPSVIGKLLVVYPAVRTKEIATTESGAAQADSGFGFLTNLECVSGHLRIVLIETSTISVTFAVATTSYPSTFIGTIF